MCIHFINSIEINDNLELMKNSQIFQFRVILCLLFLFCMTYFNSQAHIKYIDNQIRSIFQDSKGVFWFGTNSSGIFRYDSKSITQFTVKDGLADNQIISIQEDTMGNLWFGSGSFTISKFDGKNITKMSNGYIQTKDFQFDKKSSIGDLWFNAGGGALKFSDSSLSYFSFDSSSKFVNDNSPFSLSSYGVYSILKDNEGNVWFGTQAEGLCKYNGKSLKWFKEKGLSGPAILALFEDSKGNIWIGNNGAGLFRYDGKVLSNFTDENGLFNTEFIASGKSVIGTLARIYSITEDDLGNIWVGTVDSGVWKYDGTSLINFTTKDGLSSNAVNTIYKDQDGLLWFGTDSNGIFSYNGSVFTEFRFDLENELEH